MRKPADFIGHPVPFPVNPFYRAVIKHVVDGDTFDAFADVGLYHYPYLTVRLRGYDAPEIFGRDAAAERELGYIAKDFAVRELQGKPVYLVTYRDKTSFGRFEADVFYDAHATGDWRLFESFKDRLVAYMAALPYS